MIRRILLIAYAATLLLLAFTPPVPIPLQPSGFSLKLHHVAAFTVLAILIWYASEQRDRWRTLLSTILGSFLFGVGIELIQTLIPYRSGRWQDLISNSVGIAFGCLVILAVTTFQRRKEKRIRQRP